MEIRVQGHGAWAVPALIRALGLALAQPNGDAQGHGPGAGLLELGKTGNG